MKVRVENHYDLEANVKIYSTEIPDEVGQFAMQLIEKHAMLAGVEGGEDSQGRAKIRLQSPEELVERAFVTAELTYKALRDRGYLVALPDLNEVNADYDKKRAADKKDREDREAAKREARTA